MSAPSSPVRMVASVLNVQIRLTGRWTGSSASQTQLDISASVSQGLQVSKTKETNDQKSQFSHILKSFDNHLISFTLQERTAPSTSMSVSLNPARMEPLVKIRSMVTPVHALLDF